ncbi:MAG TPA: DUF2478 domain-containing protein [Pusillimonas sp.]|uniref:DUF2478 domain-containing protein n=1 Tax=unclassified Pusillimonas TaxID=2640016 RepID=UPI0026388ACC|nr:MULTISPECIES: DUF2478 domain-containing protein [unclassified Pusillimonas]HLU20281.1 DUF2478 domain-containing protein [Pusillimonas sp.]
MDQNEPNPVAAAVIHNGKGHADAPLLEFIHRLRAAGRVVRGLAPGPQVDRSDCTTRTLCDIEHGTLYPISQNLGKESQACCLDTSALIQAGQVLRRALNSGADLVIVNRFGILEADGEGFSAEMLELMSGGVPMLTVVSPPYLQAWRTFTGGVAAELPPDAEAMWQWFDGLSHIPGLAHGNAPDADIRPQ